MGFGDNDLAIRELMRFIEMTSREFIFKDATQNGVEVGDRGYFGPNFIKEAREQVSIIQSHLKATQSR